MSPTLPYNGSPVIKKLLKFYQKREAERTPCLNIIKRKKRKMGKSLICVAKWYKKYDRTTKTKITPFREQRNV